MFELEKVLSKKNNKKNRGNIEGKRIWRMIKNRFKLNKLILYVLFKLILFVYLNYIITKKI